MKTQPLRCVLVFAASQPASIVRTCDCVYTHICMLMRASVRLCVCVVLFLYIHTSIVRRRHFFETTLSTNAIFMLIRRISVNYFTANNRIRLPLLCMILWFGYSIRFVLNVWPKKRNIGGPQMDRYSKYFQHIFHPFNELLTRTHTTVKIGFIFVRDFWQNFGHCYWIGIQIIH